MHQLNKLAQDLTYTYFKNELAVGKYFRFSKKGDAKNTGIPIKIISGYFLDPIYGRVSNFWYWKQVHSDGSLSKKDNCGYGGGEDFYFPITEKEAIQLAKKLSN